MRKDTVHAQKERVDKVEIGKYGCPYGNTHVRVKF